MNKAQIKKEVAKEIFADIDKILAIMDLEEDSDEYQKLVSEYWAYEYPTYCYIDNEVDKLEKKYTE